MPNKFKEIIGENCIKLGLVGLLSLFSFMYLYGNSFIKISDTGIWILLITCLVLSIPFILKVAIWTLMYICKLFIEISRGVFDKTELSTSKIKSQKRKSV
jgi:hypothetical protein